MIALDFAESHHFTDDWVFLCKSKFHSFYGFIEGYLPALWYSYLLNNFGFNRTSSDGTSTHPNAFSNSYFNNSEANSNGVFPFILSLAVLFI